MPTLHLPLHVLLAQSTVLPLWYHMPNIYIHVWQEAAVHFPPFDKDVVQVRPGVHLYMRLDEQRVQVGEQLLHANMLQQQAPPVFVAIE